MNNKNKKVIRQQLHAMQKHNIISIPSLPITQMTQQELYKLGTPTYYPSKLTEYGTLNGEIYTQSSLPSSFIILRNNAIFIYYKDALGKMGSTTFHSICDPNKIDPHLSNYHGKIIQRYELIQLMIESIDWPLLGEKYDNSALIYEK
eukprot:46988_1